MSPLRTNPNPLDRTLHRFREGPQTMSFDPETLIYNEAGLIPAIAQDVDTDEVLMMAWMNKASIEQTLSSGRVTYWSRSRSAFWIKGETSGHTQELKEFRVDCDCDCLLLKVKQVGPACHTNRKSCFYKIVEDGEERITSAPME